MSAKKRFRVVDQFFRDYGGGDVLGYGTAIWWFMDWEERSGRLDLSPWWRIVNGTMVSDLIAARRLVRRHGADAVSASDSVQAWIDFAVASDDHQWLLWVAHDRSIQRGLRGARKWFDLEPPYERRFIESVIMNVELARGANLSTQGRGVVSKGFEFYVEAFYPTHYPATNWGDAEDSTFLRDLTGRLAGSGLEF